VRSWLRKRRVAADWLGGAACDGKRRWRRGKRRTGVRSWVKGLTLREKG